jgi:hypothetical protein
MSAGLTDFCIVAGIAAPIIALANIAAVGNAFGLVHFIRGARSRTRRGSTRQQAATQGLAFGLAMYFVSGLNWLAQAGVLLLVLKHFGYGSAVNVGLVEAAVVGGLLVTALAAILAGLTRSRATSLQAPRARKPRSEASAP